MMAMIASHADGMRNALDIRDAYPIRCPYALPSTPSYSSN